MKLDQDDLAFLTALETIENTAKECLADETLYPLKTLCLQTLEVTELWRKIIYEISDEPKED
jgi:hypothetical protein